MQQEAVSFISETEYLEIESSEITHGYYEGAMTGASEKQNLIVSNHNNPEYSVEKETVQELSGGMRLKIEETGLFRN